jgi:hypothetical protein
MSDGEIKYCLNENFADFQKHTIVAKVGTVEGTDWRPGKYTGIPVVRMTLYQNPTPQTPEGVFHQVVFREDEAIKVIEQEIQTGDIVMVALGNLWPKVYIDRKNDEVRLVPYIESRGMNIYQISAISGKEYGKDTDNFRPHYKWIASYRRGLAAAKKAGIDIVYTVAQPLNPSEAESKPRRKRQSTGTKRTPKALADDTLSVTNDPIEEKKSS